MPPSVSVSRNLDPMLDAKALRSYAPFSRHRIRGYPSSLFPFEAFSHTNLIIISSDSLLTCSILIFISFTKLVFSNKYSSALFASILYRSVALSSGGSKILLFPQSQLFFVCRCYLPRLATVHNCWSYNCFMQIDLGSFCELFPFYKVL